MFFLRIISFYQLIFLTIAFCISASTVSIFVVEAYSDSCTTSTPLVIDQTVVTGRVEVIITDITVGTCNSIIIRDIQVRSISFNAQVSGGTSKNLDVLIENVDFDPSPDGEFHLNGIIFNEAAFNLRSLVIRNSTIRFWASGTADAAHFVNFKKREFMTLLRSSLSLD